MKKLLIDALILLAFKLDMDGSFIASLLSVRFHGNSRSSATVESFCCKSAKENLKKDISSSKKRYSFTHKSKFKLSSNDAWLTKPVHPASRCTCTRRLGNQNRKTKNKNTD